MSLVLVLSVLAPAVTCLRMLPQGWRTLVGGHTSGLSLSSLHLQNALNIGFGLYGLLRGDLPLLAINILGLLIGSAVIARVSRERGQATRAISTTVVYTIALVALASVSAALVALVTAWIGPFRALPQLRQLRRAVSAEQVAGVSGATLALGAFGQGLWTLYAVLTDQPVIAISMLVTGAVNLACLFVLRQRRSPIRTDTSGRKKD